MNQANAAENRGHFYLDENQVKDEAVWSQIAEFAKKTGTVPKVHADRAAMERAAIEQWLKNRRAD